MSGGAGKFGVLVVGLVVGGALGWAGASATSGGGDLRDELETARADLAAAEERADTAEQQAAALTKRLERANGAGRRTASVEEAADEAETVDTEVAEAVAAAPEAEEEEQSAAERIRRIQTLQDQIDGLFDAGKGEEAIKALKELAALVPEGRQAAMELAVRMNQDVNGAGKLKLGQMEFYTAFGDPALKGLMQWSLGGNESVDEFREMAAWSLPWVQSPDETADRFAKALSTEKNFDVQQALVINMARLKKDEATRKLADLFMDPAKDGLLRARVATEFATTDDPEMLTALRTAAESDADPDVRAAASAALMARNPPATGFLVTGSVPESQAQAAGVRPGDIVLSYDGQKVQNSWALSRAARESKGDQPIEMKVMRNGGEVTLLVRPGRLGVYGRGVKAETSE